MKRWFLNIAAALGLTTICLAQLLEPFVRPSHDLIYHWSGRSFALFGPAVLETLALFMVLSGLLISAQYGRVWRSAVWATLLLSLPWIIIPQINVIWPGVMPHWLRLPPFRVVFLASPVLIVIWNKYVPERRERMIESATVILAFMALSSSMVISEFLWFWWKARALNRPVALHRPIEMASAHAATYPPRIIWILLDELSYQQVYEHRYEGLQLPAFDGLAGESTVFTDVVPAANYTDKAVPSLFTGEAVRENRATSDGLLMVRSAESNPWQRFDERNTVFEDARNAGYSTAAVGWYNPYCRILRNVLDRCYWTDDYMGNSGMFSNGTFESNLASSIDDRLQMAVLRNLLQRTQHGPERLEQGGAFPHLEDYRDLAEAGDKVLLDRSARFVFLHLPIPHPNGIYDRRKHQLTTKASTYIDNLALADSYLAHVRKLLEDSGQWNSSTILVMGDHGWRTSLVWKIHPEWAPEEQAASHGQFDERPAYIVKLPGQTSGTHVDTPFHAVDTRALADALLAGKIRSADELKAWAQKENQAEGEDGASRSAM